MYGARASTVDVRCTVGLRTRVKLCGTSVQRSGVFFHQGFFYFFYDGGRCASYVASGAAAGTSTRPRGWRDVRGVSRPQSSVVSVFDCQSSRRVAPRGPSRPPGPAVACAGAVIKRSAHRAHTPARRAGRRPAAAGAARHYTSRLLSSLGLRRGGALGSRRARRPPQSPLALVALTLSLSVRGGRCSTGFHSGSILLQRPSGVR